jgi:type I restriction enzyme S subunit
MVSEWEVIELVDCTIGGNISYGVVQPGQNDENGIPILRVNNFENGRLNTDSVIKISPTIDKKHSKTSLKGGEVLLTLVGSTGQTAIVPQNLKGWNVARAVAVIDVKPEIGAKWVELWLRSGKAQHHLDVRANTTVQKTLNLKDVKSIPVSVPSQRLKSAIENIIFSIEDKIELNRQMNQTLEQMAQALFKSWFVDFDPVIDNALAQGNPIPEEFAERAERRKETNGKYRPLPENIQKLFPVEFEESDEMGWIPKGWKVEPLEEITTKLGDGLHGTPEYDENGEYYFINGNNLTDGKITINQNTKRVNYSQYEKHKKEINERTVFVSINGTIGNTGEYNNEKVILGKSICYFNVKNEISKYYIKQVINSNYFFQYLETTATGTTIKNVSLKSMRGFPVIIPSQLILAECERELKSLNRKIQKNHDTIESLTKLRDTLLPRLISGKLRVGEVEGV